MAYLCIVFAIWLVRHTLPTYFTTPEWFPFVVSLGMGIGGQCLVDADNWWWGIGWAGLAAAILMFTDLALVTTDALRERVIAGTRRRG